MAHYKAISNKLNSNFNYRLKLLDFLKYREASLYEFRCLSNTVQQNSIVDRQND